MKEFKTEKELVRHLRKVASYSTDVSVYPTGMRYLWDETVYNARHRFTAFVLREIPIYIRDYGNTAGGNFESVGIDRISGIHIPLDVVVGMGPVQSVEISLNSLTPAEEKEGETGVHTLTLHFFKNLYLSWTIKRNRSCNADISFLDSVSTPMTEQTPYNEYQDIVIKEATE